LESDKRHQPAYGLAEAAHHVRVPVATLRSWVLGRAYESKFGRRTFAPIIVAADRRTLLLSFANLIEAHVLHALRTEHTVSIKAVRNSLRYAERELKVTRLLLSEELRASGGDLFLDRYGDLINLSRSGQLAMKALLRDYLARVEWNRDGIPGRLYPFVRGAAANAPKLITIDPRIAFGRPVLVHQGISVRAIAERIDAGETVEALVDDYGVTSQEIEEALVFQRAA
jgi:uncharacterized protein (DUF433 family)